MSGCDNCGAKEGCSHRKNEMFQTLEVALNRLYPSGTWGVRDHAVEMGAGVSDREVEMLADGIADRLDAAVVLVPGEQNEYCSYIYVLCLGRAPCLAQVRDLDFSLPDEMAETPGVVSERYLRVCVSHLARFAAVQEVSMSLTFSNGSYLIEELARSGVYDAPLLPRLRKVVTLLQETDFCHLDFGEICEPPPGFSPGSYSEQFLGEPAVVNYMFYPQPSETPRVSLVRSENRAKLG